MERTSDAGISTKASRLFCFADLNTLMDALVELVKANTSSLESLVTLADLSSHELRFDQLRSSLHIDGGLSAWLCEHFKKHPSLNQKLLRSELIALSPSDAGTNSHYSPGIRANVVLVPVLHEGAVIAAFGLFSREDHQPTMIDLEHVRWCAVEAAAPLVRMRELELLRKETTKVRELIEQLATVGATVHDLSESVTQLKALAVMRAGLQANAAHDMRTPLAAIRGYARMILDGHAGEVSRTQRDYLEVAVENTNKLIHLVNWMSRIADAERDLAPKSVDLRDLWKECVASHVWELNANSMRIEEAPVVPPASFEITADRAKMQGALHQLIRAAIQYGGQGTRLTLEFSRPKNGVALKLSGMKRPFPDNSTDFPYVGPLQQEFSDVHDVIGMHGGRFFVRRSDECAVFMFTLPAVLQEAKDACVGRRSA